VPSLSIDPVAGSALSKSNPFPGLRPYEEPDADWFFGRGAEINDLLKRLRRLHFVAIVGASGCGKSSLIRAGVLPHIRDGYLDAKWSIAAFRPGERPLANLAEALCPELSCSIEAFTDTLHSGSLGLVKAVQSANLQAGSKVLILVDQFEELFQFAQRKGDSAQEEVKQFLKLMLSAAASDDVAVYVVVTMRLEWLNECATYVGLAEAINEGIYLVPQMSRRQFSQAIMGPLEAAGGAITSALLDRMLNDLDGRSDQLPVLQHALLRIWERRGGKDTFDAKDYESVGTFANCLSDHAEEVFRELNNQQKAVAEALFRSITHIYKNRKIRRPRPVEEILTKTGGDFAQLEAVIAAFSRTGRSFLVTTKGKLEPSSIVDVSHEALIRQWGRLSAWVEEEAELQSRLARLEGDAAEWDRDRKAFKSSLYRGYQLRRAQKDLAPLLDPSGTASAFLKAGQRARLQFIGGITAAVVAACLLLIGLAAREVHDNYVRQREQLALADQQKALAQQQAQLAADQAQKAQQFQQNLVQQIDAAKGNATALAAIAQNIQAQRVYLQYVRGEPVQQAKTVQGLLQKRGYSVPGIEQVAPDRSPSQTQVRYFHPEDQAGADKIASLLKPLVQGTVTTQGTANPNNVVPTGQFEVWLAASAASQLTEAGTNQAAPQAQTAEKKPETQAAPAVVTPAPTIVLVSSQNTIQQGQPVTLTWQTDNATDVQIEGVGAVQPSGSTTVTPAQTTTYDLTAKGPGGTTTKSLLVAVTPAVAATPVTPVVPVNPDPQAIHSALNRYREAYESESLDDLKQAWPSMSKNDQKNTKAVFDQFNAIRLTITCPDSGIQIQGDAATVTCTQSAVFTQKGKKQPVPPTTTTFKLRRQGTGWVVDSVQ
jgi:energy-coupling factor transporter ATP-binding protein EcfA2